MYLCVPSPAQLAKYLHERKMFRTNTVEILKHILRSIHNSESLAVLETIKQRNDMCTFQNSHTDQKRSNGPPNIYNFLRKI